MSVKRGSGSFVVAIKGLVGSNHFVRLAQYSLRPDGTAYQVFWFVGGDGPKGGMAHGAVIGKDGTNSNNSDQNYRIVSSSDFLSNIAPRRDFCGGRWSILNDELAITWNEGQSNNEDEFWNLRDVDEHLQRLDLFSTNYTSSGFLHPHSELIGVRAARAYNVFNAGWGFGGPGNDFDTAVDFSTIAEQASLSGFTLNYNPRQLQSEMALTWQSINLPHYTKTSTGVLRAKPTQSAGTLAYNYISDVKGGPNDPFPRRIILQNGHDYDGDGNIADLDSNHHAYTGLQIIDMKNDFRGIVMTHQQIYQPWEVGALYYLDAESLGEAAEIQNTVSGSEIPPRHTFTWTSGKNASEYWLWISSEGDPLQGGDPGGDNVYNGSLGAGRAFTFVAPSEGIFYVRLWTRISTQWIARDFWFRVSQ